MRHGRGKKANSKPGSRIPLENVSKQEESGGQGTSNTLHLNLTISDNDDDLKIINFVRLDSKSIPIILVDL